MSQSPWSQNNDKKQGFLWRGLSNEPQNYAIVVVLLAALIGSVWWYYHYDPEITSPKLQRPLMKADPGPYRIRPENYGKVEIQHQDKQIYASLDGEMKRNEVYKSDNSKDEQPLVIVNPRPPLKTDGSQENASRGNENAQLPPPDDGAASGDASSPIQVVPAQQVQAATQLMKKAISDPPQRKDLAKQGLHWVRLATLQNYDSALKETSRIQKLFKDVFGNKTTSIAMVNLDSGGRLYPIYLGPFEAPEDAQKLCEQIQNKIGCLVEKLLP